MKPPKINHILIVLISTFLISDIDTEHNCNIAIPKKKYWKQYFNQTHATHGLYT